MASRTATQKLFTERSPFLDEEWSVTGTYVAGTDTLAAITPNKIKKVISVTGNFDDYSVSGGAYTFTFSATVAKPSVRFTGFGR